MKIIKRVEDFELLELVEDNQLMGDWGYGVWKERCFAIYDKFVRDNGLEFRPYQYEYAAMYCLRHHNLLAGGLGLGKSSIALVAINAVYGDFRNRRVGTVQIVVRNGLNAMRFIEELERFEGLRDHYEVISTTRELVRATKPILVYGMDFLKNRMPARTDNNRSTNRGRKVAGDYIYQYFRPNFLVIDEAHDVGDGTKRASKLNKLRRRAKRSLQLSGTVSDGGLRSVHQLVKFTYRSLFPYLEYEQFNSIYGTKSRLSTNYLTGSLTQAGEKWVENLNPMMISDYYYLMRSYVHRVRLSDPEVASFITLPEERVFVHKVVPTGMQASNYLKLVRQQQAQMEAVARSEGVRARAAALRLMHPLIRLVNSPEGVTPKLEKLIEIIEGAKGKVGIFVERVDSGVYLQRQLAERGIPSLLLSAQLGNDERVEAVREFQYGEVKAGIFSIRLAGASIDLTSGTDLVYYCLPWSVRLIRQAGGRMVRPGNRNDEVRMHYLCHVGLVDEHQYNLAATRIKQSRLVDDYELLEHQEGGIEEVVGDLSPLAALQSILQHVG